MRRAAKWLGWIVAGIIGIPLMLIACRFHRGQHRGRAAGDREHDVTADRRHGPDRLPVGTLSGRVAGWPRGVLRDPEATTRRSPISHSDWSPLELVHRRVVIDRLAADDVDVMRVPGGQSSGGSISLPVPVTLRALQVDRLEVGGGGGGDCGRRRRVRVGRGQQPERFPCGAGGSSTRRIRAVHGGRDQ